MDWGWLVVFFAQPFHTNVSNYPEKASQRQRGKTLGYSGCIQSLPCSTTRSCKSSICYRLIAFPRSSFSCADSSDAQMDTTLPQRLRQDPSPRKRFLPGVPALWRTGLRKDPARGERRPVLGGWDLLPNDLATMCQKE